MVQAPSVAAILAGLPLADASVLQAAAACLWVPPTGAQVSVATFGLPPSGVTVTTSLEVGAAAAIAGWLIRTAPVAAAPARNSVIIMRRIFKHPRVVTT